MTKLSSEAVAHAQRGLHGVERIVEAIDDLVEIAIARFGTNQKVIVEEVFRADARVERESIVIRDRHRLRTDDTRDAVVEICRGVTDARKNVGHEGRARV